MGYGISPADTVLLYLLSHIRIQVSDLHLRLHRTASRRYLSGKVMVYYLWAPQHAMGPERSSQKTGGSLERLAHPSLRVTISSGYITFSSS